jgi:hypothetical protein
MARVGVGSVIGRETVPVCSPGNFVFADTDLVCCAVLAADVSPDKVVAVLHKRSPTP